MEPRRCQLLTVGNLQTRLSKAFDHPLDKVWSPKNRENLPPLCFELRPLGQQSLQQNACRFDLAKLPKDCRHDCACAPEAGHVHFAGKLKREAVIAFAIGVEARNKPIPSRVVRIETASLGRQLATIFPVAVVRDKGTQESDGESVHRSEEHTSELQSPCNLVCRLLLEK